MAFHLECQRHKDILKKAAGRMANVKLTAAWNKWFELVLIRREKQNKQNR